MPATKIGKLKRGQYVRVRWVDSCAHSGWHTPHGKPRVSKIESIGMIGSVSDTAIEIIGDIDRAHGDINRVMSIPRACVISVKVIG